jgi:SAM-dependent methyltransferase
MTERMTQVTPAHVRDYHEARYRFAAERANGKSVLDVACGDGYGSAILAKVAKSVTSVDPRAQLAHPVERHVSCFAEEMSFSEEFDLVVSLETIEHTIAPRVFLAALWRVLRPGGEVIMSFPNHWGESEFHLHDTGIETISVVSEFFDVSAVYGQNRRTHKVPERVQMNRPPSFWVENIILVGARRPACPEVRPYIEMYLQANRLHSDLRRTFSWRVKHAPARLRTALRRRFSW